MSCRTCKKIVFKGKATNNTDVLETLGVKENDFLVVMSLVKNQSKKRNPKRKKQPKSRNKVKKKQKLKKKRKLSPAKKRRKRKKFQKEKIASSSMQMLMN